MALNWNWDSKIGELLIRQGEKEFMKYTDKDLFEFVYRADSTKNKRQL